MLSKYALAFGELSKRKVRENFDFASGMTLHGEKRLVPCRGGDREALLHRSKSKEPAPTIFEIYGGCFSQGYVANNDRMRALMHEATGYNVIGLDYRKSPDFPYPCGMEDIYDAIAYFCAHAEEFNLDAGRLGVWGHSAGANLACAMALRSKETGAFRLKAQLLDYPYLDLHTPGNQKTSSATGLTAEVLDAMNEIYASQEQRGSIYLSPVLADPGDLAGLAPAAITVCGRDPLKEEALAMAGKLLRAGVPVVSRLFPEASHGFLEHWFFREYYLDALSPEERAGIPDNIGELAEEGLRFVIASARLLLES